MVTLGNLASSSNVGELLSWKYSLGTPSHDENSDISDFLNFLNFTLSGPRSDVSSFAL